MKKTTQLMEELNGSDDINSFLRIDCQVKCNKNTKKTF